jgi:hypothetical protein
MEKENKAMKKKNFNKTFLPKIKGQKKGIKKP